MFVICIFQALEVNEGILHMCGYNVMLCSRTLIEESERLQVWYQLHHYKLQSHLTFLSFSAFLHQNDEIHQLIF